MDPVKFSLTFGTLPVTLSGPDGEEVQYELREMMASVRDKYLDQLGNRMRLDAKGAPAGIKNFDGLQTSLLAACLYKDGQPVKPQVIQSWPAGLVSDLFEKAQELNRLSSTKEEVAEEAKKD